VKVVAPPPWRTVRDSNEHARREQAAARASARIERWFEHPSDVELLRRAADDLAEALRP
jgi:hypothetical protein